MDFYPKKKLGFGRMRLPVLDKNDDANVDVEQVKKMVDLFMEKGFTYFDTAWMYNGFMRENLAEKGWTINFTNYENLAAKFGKASACIECGQCESVCPQHLTIIDYLKDLAGHYEAQ